jgi:hypothetical protein
VIALIIGLLLPVVAAALYAGLAVYLVVPFLLAVADARGYRQADCRAAARDGRASSAQQARQAADRHAGAGEHGDGGQAACGYFDQAHLTNDWRRMAGFTPNKCVGGGWPGQADICALDEQ